MGAITPISESVSENQFLVNSFMHFVLVRRPVFPILELSSFVVKPARTDFLKGSIAPSPKELLSFKWSKGGWEQNYPNQIRKGQTWFTDGACQGAGAGICKIWK